MGTKKEAIKNNNVDNNISINKNANENQINTERNKSIGGLFDNAEFNDSGIILDDQRFSEPLKKTSPQVDKLKKNIENKIPVVIPKNTVIQDTSKQSTAKQNTALKKVPQKATALKKVSQKGQKQFAVEMIEEYHNMLEAAEEKVFGENTAALDKVRLADITESNMGKRVKNAINREKYMKTIILTDSKIQGEEYGIGDIDEAGLEKELKAFLKLPSSPKSMSDDEEFVKNLEYNLNLCEKASHVKKWLDDAANGGYLPKGFDLKAIEEKIAGLEEAKFYIYEQKEIMKNPYYLYLAKKDVSYTDDQLDKMTIELKNDSDTKLIDYLNHLKTIRGLSYVRKKGMGSVKKKAAKTGRKRAEVLTTRKDKTALLERLEEHALNYKADKRFTDENYDRRYSAQAFQEAKREFMQISPARIHLKDFYDMTSHFEENTYLFEQAKSIDHLLFCAVNAGEEIPDDEIIKLRARIRVFQMAEAVQMTVLCRVVSHREEFLHEDSFEDIMEDVKNTIKSARKTDNRDRSYGYPEFGTDMNKLLRSVETSMKREHGQRKELIKKMYSLTHLHKPEDEGEDADVNWEGEEIGEEKLTKRMNSFQKNAAICDYYAGMSVCTDLTFYQRQRAFMSVYKKNHPEVKKLPQLGRVLNMETMAMSSDEFAKWFKDYLSDSKEAHNRIAKKILERAKKGDLTAIDSNDQKVINSNAGARYVLANQYANLNEIESLLTDENDKILSQMLYDVGVGHAQKHSGFVQAMVSAEAKGVFFDDWFATEQKLLSDFYEYGNGLSDIPDEPIMLNGKKLADGSDWEGYHHYLSNSITVLDAKGSYFNPEHKIKGYKNTVFISSYEARKHYGKWKDTTAEDTTKIKNFLSDYFANFNAEYKDLTSYITGKRDKNGKAVRPDFAMFASMLAGDDHERAFKRYTALNGNMETKEQKKSAIAEFEDLFKMIMSFDAANFNFDSYADIIKDTEECKDRFKKCHAMASLCYALIPFIPQYENLIETDAKSCLLGKEQLKEVKARLELFSTAQSFYGNSLLTLIESGKVKENEHKEEAGLDELLHLPIEEINKNLNDSFKGNDKKVVDFWQTLSLVATKTEGFDANVDIRTLLEKYRIAHGTTAESSPESVKNLLEGKKGTLKLWENRGTINSRFLDEKGFLDQFAKKPVNRDLTVSARYDLMDENGTELYVKRDNAKFLLNESNHYKNQLAEARMNISLDVRRQIGEENFELLKGLVIGISKDFDERLLLQYVDMKTRRKTLDQIASKVVERNIEYTLLSDAGIANNAHRLEEVSQLATTAKKLFDANPWYMESLNVYSNEGKTTDAHLLNARLNRLLAVSDYYRARKLLITHPYYISHFNDEISREYTATSRLEQRQVADLVDLVARCARRLEGKEVTERDNESMEALLTSLEQKAQQYAFVDGRPDITLAEVGKVEKNNKEIKNYLEKAIKLFGKDAKGNYKMDVFKVVAEISKKEGSPFEKLEKYETPAVSNYIKMIQTRYHLYDINKKDILIGEENKKFFNDLAKLMKDESGDPIGEFAFEDKKTGEVLKFTTEPSRMVNNLFFTYGSTVPQKEFMEMIKGFLIVNDKSLDMNNDKDREYAKNRWLDSASKLFKLQYNYVKKYEMTYGSLVGQLPPGMFIGSLGMGAGDFYLRSLFPQDVAEFTEQKDTVSKGQNMSICRYLADHGLINKGDLDELITLSGEYYYSSTSVPMKYVRNQGGMFFSKDKDLNHGYKEYMLDNHKVNTHRFVGPSLSFAGHKKAWKEAIASKDWTIAGGSTNVYANKKNLNIFSSSERKKIRKQRAEDRQILISYESFVQNRLVEVSNKVKSLSGKEVPEDLIEKFIMFHPAMRCEEGIDVMEKKANVTKKDTDEFLGLLKDLSGIGVPKEKATETKSKAVDKLLSIMSDIAKGGFLGGYDVPEDLGLKTLIDGNVRRYKEHILGRSIVYKTALRKQMANSLQDFMIDQANKEALNEKHYKSFKKQMKGIIGNQLMWAVYGEESYLSLMDLGNREKSVPAIELAYLERMAASLSVVDASDEIFDERLYALLKSKNIRLEKSLMEYGEKKAAETKEERVVNPPENTVDNKESETRIDNNIIINDNKITGEDNRINVPVDDDADTRTMTYEERILIYTDKELVAHEKELEKLGVRVPKSRDDVAALRQELFNTVEDNKGKQHYVPKEGVSDKVLEHVNWVGAYYVTQDMTLDQNIKEKELRPIPVNSNRKAKLTMKGMDNAYEEQTANNCFCVAGAALINQFISRRKRDKVINRYVSQTDLRAFKPEIKQYKDEFAKSGVGKEVYDAAVEEIKQYTIKKDVALPGNIFELGDFVLDKVKELGHPEAVLNRMHFTIPSDVKRSDRSRIKQNNMKAVMIDRINEILDAGGVVALYTASQGYAHYVTVTEINGESLTVYDSVGYKSRQVKTSVHSVDEFLKPDHTVELTWLSDLKKPQELTQEFSNLSYDEEKGYSVKELPPEQSKQMILHAAQTKGICVNKTLQELGPDTEGIYQYAYIPNPKTTVDSVPIEEYGKKITKVNSTATAKDNKINIMAKPVSESAVKENSFLKGIDIEKVKEYNREAKKNIEYISSEVPFFDLKGEQAAIKEKDVTNFLKSTEKKIKPVESYIGKEGRNWLDASAKQGIQVKTAGFQERWLVRLSGGMAQLAGYSKTDALNMYKILYRSTDGMSDAEKKEKAREYEKIFKLILSFDVKMMNFGSFADLLDKSRVEVSTMTRVMYDFQPSFLKEYEKLMKDPMVNCALDDDLFGEVKARWELMHRNCGWFNEFVRQIPVAQKNNVNLSELVKMSSGDIAALMTQAAAVRNKELVNLYTQMMTIVNSGTNTHFGPGYSAEKALDRLRKDTYKLGDKSRASDAIKQIDSYSSMKYEAPSQVVPVSEEAKQDFADIENLYKGSGISKQELNRIKDNRNAYFNYRMAMLDNMPKNADKEIRDAGGCAIDLRDYQLLFRPVHRDKNGKPLTKEDEKNLKANAEDHKRVLTNKLSDRKPYLDYLAEETERVMFTPEQLSDEDYILSNRERALRCITYMHCMLNNYTAHKKYYLTQADPAVRRLMFLMFDATDYGSYMERKLSYVLFGQGYGNGEITNERTQKSDFVIMEKGMRYSDVKYLNSRLGRMDLKQFVNFMFAYNQENHDKNILNKNILEALDEAEKEGTTTFRSLAKADQEMYLLEYPEKKFEKNTPITAKEQVNEAVKRIGDYLKKKDDKNYTDMIDKAIQNYIKSGKEVTNNKKIIDDLK